MASLIIVNGTARIARHDDYPVGVPKRALDRFLELNFEPDAVERGYDSLEFFAPSVVRDDAFREWWTRAGNRGAGPATAKLIDRVRLGADVRALLPLVRVPTLVLHCRDNAALGVGHGRYLAEHIPNATYVELPGADDLYWVGDNRLMLDEIEQFLSGDTHDRESGGVLATVVCADIVGLSALGEVRERCDEAVRRQLRRFQGREIRTTYHDVMATFDGPARAVSCARFIRDAVVELGFQVRIGVHIGAVAAHADNDDGVAFELAAQVAAVADPGEVLVSRTVVDVIVGSGIETANRGEHVLTSASGRWQLFAVRD